MPFTLCRIGPLFATILALVATLWTAACQPTVTTGPLAGGGGATPGGAVPVALLVPRGSGDPKEDQLARDLEDAARLAIADLSGTGVDLRVYGTAGQTGQAATAARNAVQDGARIILGPLRAEEANAAAIAIRGRGRGVNVLAFSNNPTIAGGNLFILGQTFGDTARRLARFATLQGKRRAVAVHATDTSGQMGVQAIESAMAEAGASLAGRVGYDFSQDAVVAAVPRIVRVAEENAADALFFTANTAGALPILTQMLAERGLDNEAVQYIGLTRWDLPPQTLDLPGVQGGWFAVPDPLRAAAFEARFEAANGRRPHALAGLAYDGIAAVGALVSRGGPRALSRGDLTQPAGFEGVNGIFRLLPDGTNDRGLAVATIRDRKVEVIDPAPRSFGGAGL
mgnify:CR=1 FL=1